MSAAELSSATLNEKIAHQEQSILVSHRRHTEIEELDAAIGRLSRHMNACSYHLMVMIRKFDDRAGWLKWGFTDALSWLRWRCDLSANAARDKLRVAHALKKLPAMSVQFELGALSYSKVRSLTCIATVDNEQELIDLAVNLTVANVEEHCRQRINTTEAATTGCKKAHNKRALRLWHNDKTGLMNFAFELTFEEGALFEQAVEKAAVQLAAEAANTPGKMQGKDGPGTLCKLMLPC